MQRILELQKRTGESKAKMRKVAQKPVEPI